MVDSCYQATFDAGGDPRAHNVWAKEVLCYPVTVTVRVNLFMRICRAVPTQYRQSRASLLHATPTYFYIYFRYTISVIMCLNRYRHDDDHEHKLSCLQSNTSPQVKLAHNHEATTSSRYPIRYIHAQVRSGGCFSHFKAVKRTRLYWWIYQGVCITE